MRRPTHPDLIAEQAVGTIDPAAWAGQIRARVAAEFDRLAKMLETAAGARPKGTQDVIAILGQKRAEVMARDNAGNFIYDWQQLRDQVQQMILQDPRCQPIKAHQLSMLP